MFVTKGTVKHFIFGCIFLIENVLFSDGKHGLRSLAFNRLLLKTFWEKEENAEYQNFFPFPKLSLPY